MSTLQIEFLLLFCVVTVLAFVLGRWTVRRSFVDVTQSYETIAKAAASEVPWDMLWARFDSLDVTMRRIVQEELAARSPSQGVQS